MGNHFIYFFRQGLCLLKKFLLGFVLLTLRDTLSVRKSLYHSAASMLGNRQANIRAGVSRQKADEAAGGQKHVLTLPIPSAARHREMTARTPNPGVAGMDYFMMKVKVSKKDPYEGMLVVIQPWSFMLYARRITKRSSRVSYIRVSKLSLFY